jgi:hypothetical protein
MGSPPISAGRVPQAVQAGLDAVAAVRELSLQAHAGIASGPVVVGDLDTAGRRQTGAVAGETPNLAARLEALAGPDQVVIDGLTRQLVGGAFRLEELGPQSLKGFAEPVRAWRVLGERAVESRFEARAGRLTPFIGREQEVALLIERFERAAGGEGQAVLLSGEAGIGKSRLVQMLHESLSAAPSPPTRLRMQCAPFHAASALHPVIRHLRYAAGFLAEDGPEDRLDKLEALLRQGIEDVGESAALLAPLLSLPGDRYGTLADLTPEQRNERLNARAGRSAARPGRTQHRPVRAGRRALDRRGDARSDRRTAARCRTRVRLPRPAGQPLWGSAPSRSRRASRDACKVSGISLSPEALPSSTADLVSSSMNSGTPPARSPMTAIISSGSAAPPAARATSAAWPRLKRLSVSPVTCG